MTSHLPPMPDDAPRVAAADPLVGLTVADRYRILGPLGAGGMGVVYKVEHARIGKLMAMKLLSGELSRDPNLVKRFKREAQLASRLSHPSTVQVFDFGQSEGLTYLVMELVAGDDLGRIAKTDGPMQFLRVARLVVQVCGSLAEAHGLGIVHRDLKPENVMVMRAPETTTEIAKVCDFGLAKLRESTESNDVTSHGAVVGTPYYMSPEQIRGEDVDARTDIYALGGVIYKLLTGSPPFTGQNPMAVFARHLTEDPVPPSKKLPEMGIPRSMDEIVMKALAKRREDRYARIEDMQSDLVDVLRAGNVSSVEMLVDSSELRSLQQKGAAALETTQLAGVAPGRQAATRDEVEAFERSLARQRLLGQVGLVIAIVVVAAGGVRAWTVATAKPAFDGKETEPNDDAAHANVVPFGTRVQGYVGKRLSPQSSDRDFFAFDVPAGTSVARLRTTALPNFATCTWLYRAGSPDPLARLCTTAPGRDLEVPALRVEPGRYFVAVLQDVDPYGRDAVPPVFENVSDPYEVEFGPESAPSSLEIEPNDTPQLATRVRPGMETRGALAFHRDIDVFCPPDNSGGGVRWLVKDAVDRARDAGAVVEATVERGGNKEAVKVVIHRNGVQGPAGPTQIVGPWTSPKVTLDGAPGTGCLTLRLVPDPWANTERKVPPPGPEHYSVKLEDAP
jgi:serine/threonine-protein kinase